MLVPNHQDTLCTLLPLRLCVSTIIRNSAYYRSAQAYAIIGQRGGLLRPARNFVLPKGTLPKGTLPKGTLR